MIEDALGSRAKLRLVRILALRPEAESTTEDLVRTTGQSTGTLVPALQQLAQAGIIVTRIEGRARLYKISPDGGFTSLLTRLFREETAMIDKIADHVARRAMASGLRYACWMHDEVDVADSKRSAIQILLIAEDAARAKTLGDDAAKPWDFVHVQAIRPDQAKAALARDEETLTRAIEIGRVVFADKAWLEG